MQANCVSLDFWIRCRSLGILPSRWLLTVDIGTQTVSLFKQASASLCLIGKYQFAKTFRCSTSRFGIGQVEGSNCTPLGLHRIAKKIGGNQPIGTVFKGRKPIGTIDIIGI